LSTTAHYRVADGLLAGAYPGAPGSVEALEEAGVTLFVDLTHPSDPLERYEHRRLGARRIGHPIPDMGTPTAATVIRILDDIEGERTSGGSVYVHCWGGVGRTGAVVGCWFARHGLDDGDPIATIAQLRASIAGTRPSPETPEQVALVRGWSRGR
jgi:hypothetical protein